MADHEAKTSKPYGSRSATAEVSAADRASKEGQGQLSEKSEAQEFPARVKTGMFGMKRKPKLRFMK